MLDLFLGRFADVARARQAFRIIPNQKLDESFAHLATKIGKFTRVRAADERAYFNCCLLRVRHLQTANFPIPLWIVFDEPLQFLAQFANGRLIIEIKDNRAEQIGRNATPVLKRFSTK